MQLESPNQQIELQVTAGDELTICILQNGTTLLESSPIGMNIREIGEIGIQPKVTKVSQRSVSGQKIVSPIYKKSEVEENYNELTVQFKGKYS